MRERVELAQRQERPREGARRLKRLRRQLFYSTPSRSLLHRGLAESSEKLFEQSLFPGPSDAPETCERSIGALRVALVVFETISERFVELETEVKEGAHFVWMRELTARGSVCAQGGLPG